MCTAIWLCKQSSKMLGVHQSGILKVWHLAAVQLHRCVSTADTTLAAILLSYHLPISSSFFWGIPVLWDSVGGRRNKVFKRPRSWIEEPTLMPRSQKYSLGLLCCNADASIKCWFRTGAAADTPAPQACSLVKPAPPVPFKAKITFTSTHLHAPLKNAKQIGLMDLQIIAPCPMDKQSTWVGRNKRTAWSANTSSKHGTVAQDHAAKHNAKQDKPFNSR